MGLQLPHILLFALILLLVFGGNRFSNMMGDIAKGLKSFKQGMAEDDKPQQTRQLPPQNQAPQQPIDITPRPAEPTAPPPTADDQTK